MPLNTALIHEFKYETAVTRNFLERVPLDKATWKPHPKSMALGRLTSHIAELPRWMSVTLDAPELDFATGYTPAPEFTSTTELLDYFDHQTGQSLKSLEKATDSQLSETWTLRNGNHVFFTRPRTAVLRDMVFSHLVHHRAQLGLYLRLLDLPVPSSYGPTADEQL